MALTEKGKKGVKILAGTGILVAALFGARHYYQNYGDAKMASSVPKAQGELAEFEESAPTAPTTGTAAVALPGTKLASVAGPKVKMLIIPWNSQMGLNLANGGPKTVEGSLMQKHGVNLTLERQDDYVKLQEALVACATQLSEGARNCTNGANFVSIMGDGAPAFFAGVNPQLEKLGPEYKAEIVGSAGRSYGEDKFMAPPAILENKEKARGIVVAGYLMDGDWNLAIYWADQNEICNNPDPATYDPDCLNWVSTSSFVEADEKYIQGYCEDRPVVRKGKRTGETKKVCVNAVVTWTPGDVTVAKKKGGLASVWSTRENGSQMPQVTIGIRKWNESNRKTVVGLLKGMFEGGDQVKIGGVAALKRAAQASAEIYKEENAAYWMRYYRGVEEDDAQGLPIRLGGSRVFNLADNLANYGLVKGKANAYAITYKMFGDYAVHQYAKQLPSYPSVEEVVNLSYIKEIAAEGAVAEGKADAPVFDEAPAATETLAKKSWRINFDTGKATFGTGAESDLKQLLSALVVADNTIVEIYGHTDNTGSPDANQRLSESRAFAVKKYLESNAAGNFPDNRVRARGLGQSQPVASNESTDGRALNRRVDIILKANN